MYVRARFECESVKETLPLNGEKVRFEVSLFAKDFCEGDNANWSPGAKPTGVIVLTVTDEAQAQQFRPGRHYAVCIASITDKTSWRSLLNRICNLRKRQESFSAWSRFILWLTPAGLFGNCIWVARGYLAA